MFLTIIACFGFFSSGILHILVKVQLIKNMEELLLKSEKTTQSFNKTFHLYQEGDKYFLRRDLYKSKNKKHLMFSDDFEIELVNLKIPLPCPFIGTYCHYSVWIPALNFTITEGNMFNGPVRLAMAKVWMRESREYEISNRFSEEFIKNYIRKMKLKSILD